MDKLRIAEGVVRGLKRIDFDKYDCVNIAKHHYKRIIEINNQDAFRPAKSFFREYILRHNDLLILVKKPEASAGFNYGDWGIESEVLFYKMTDDKKVFIGCYLLYRNFYETEDGLYQLVPVFKNRAVSTEEAKKYAGKARRLLVSFHKALATGVISVEHLYKNGYYVQKGS